MPVLTLAFFAQIAVGERLSSESGRFKARALESLIEDDSSYGFEVGSMVAIGRAGDQSAKMVGGEIGLLIDHENLFSLLYATQSPSTETTLGSGTASSSLGNWGISYLGIIGWDSIVNSRYGIFWGGGALDLEKSDGATVSHSIYIVEPKTGIYFNLLPFLKIGFDISYRFVAVDAAELRGEEWSGFSYGVALRGGAL